MRTRTAPPWEAAPNDAQRGSRDDSRDDSNDHRLDARCRRLTGSALVASGKVPRSFTFSS
jgi:hypothetical protein